MFDNESNPLHPSRTIFFHLPEVHPTKQILDTLEGKGWKDAEFTTRRELERRVQEEYERRHVVLREIPKAEW